MAKYFGHRPAWSGGTKGSRPAAGFGTSRGGPVVPFSGNGKPVPRRSGPASGFQRMVPSGSAGGPARVPNTGTPRSAMPYAGAMARGRAANTARILRGLFGPVGLALTLVDLTEWMMTQPETNIPAAWDIPAGWMKCPTPNCEGPIDYYGWASTTGDCAPFATCPVGQAVSSLSTGNGTLPGVVHPTRRGLIMCDHTSGTIGTSGARYTMRHQFIRASSAVKTLPQFMPATVKPRVVQPAPATLAPPRPSDAVKTYPRARPRDRPRARPNPRPWEVPAVTINVPPKGPQTITDTPHPLQPPGPGMKEKKWRLTDPKLAKFYGTLTEFADAADCAIKNIANKKRRPPPPKTLHGKLKYIHDNMGDLDMAGFAMCLAADHIEDKIIGKVNQLANRITKDKNWVRPVGVGRGSFGARMPKM